MGNIGTIISIGAIAVILVVLYYSFKSFNFEGVGKSIEGFGGGLSSKITGFFDNLSDETNNTSNDETDENTIPSDPSEQTDEQQEEIFGKKLTDDEEQTINDIEDALGRNDKEAVSEIINNFDGSDTLLRDFNPPGKFGYGILGKNKKGIDISLAKELGIYDYTTSQITPEILDRINQGHYQTDDDDPQPSQEKTESRNKEEIIASAKERHNQRQKEKRKKEPELPLSKFLRSDNSIFLKKGETAGQRNNRIFKATGLTRDELISGKTKKSTFNFGTNTGSGRKTPTTNRGGERLGQNGVKKRQELRRAKELEEARSRKVFDSASISNW